MRVKIMPGKRHTHLEENMSECTGNGKPMASVDLKQMVCDQVDG